MIRHCFALVESPDPLAFRYPIVSDPSPQHTSVSSSQVPPEIESEAREDRSPSETADIGAPQRKPVQIFLEASLAGEPLYARFGFHRVYVSEIVYKGETVSWPVMVCERFV